MAYDDWSRVEKKQDFIGTENSEWRMEELGESQVLSLPSAQNWGTTVSSLGVTAESSYDM